MAFKIFGRKKSPESVENYSFPIEESRDQGIGGRFGSGTAGGGTQRLPCNC